MDACIIGIPLYGLDPSLAAQMDSLELSIYYFKLTEQPNLDYQHIMF